MKRSTTRMAKFGMAVVIGLALIWPLALGSLFGGGAAVAIATPKRSSYKQTPLTTNKPPSSSNRTGKAAGKGDSSACPETPIPLTALIPTENIDGKEYAWSPTQSDRPVLWIYMPYAQKDGWSFPVTLTVTDANGKQIQDDKGKPVEKSLALPEDPGIIRVSLPQEMPALVAGQFYKWTLHVSCDPPNEISVWLMRIGPKPSSSKLPTLALAEDYAKAGLWADALTTLGDLQDISAKSAKEQALAKSAKEQWQILLEDTKIGLQNVAQQKIVSWDD